MMEESKVVIKKKPLQKKGKRPRKKFLEVDVWRAEFGPVSERAIYDIFSQKFNIEPHNMQKYSFQHCVNSLRKLENSDYVMPELEREN